MNESYLHSLWRVKKKDAFRRMKGQCSGALNTVSCDCCFYALCGALYVWLCVRENLLIGSDISLDKKTLYTQCSRNTFYCTLFTVPRLLNIVQRKHISIHGLLYTVCIWFAVHFLLYTYYCTRFTVHCSQKWPNTTVRECLEARLQSSLGSWLPSQHCTLYTLQLYSLNKTPITLDSTPNTIHYTLYNIHHTLETDAIGACRRLLPL